MNKTLTIASVLILMGSLTAAEPLKSGLQVGERVSPFDPLNVTGEYAGQEKCLVCHFGGSPVACVFASEANPRLISLLKKLDEATAKHIKAELGSFVCLCTENKEGLEKDLREMAKKEGLKSLIIALCPAAGPEDYKISKQAEVTVMLYVEGQIKANFAFEKGQMTEKDIDAIVAALPKILPAK